MGKLCAFYFIHFKFVKVWGCCLIRICPIYEHMRSLFLTNDLNYLYLKTQNWLCDSFANICLQSNICLSNKCLNICLICICKSDIDPANYNFIIYPIFKSNPNRGPFKPLLSPCHWPGLWSLPPSLLSSSCHWSGRCLFFPSQSSWWRCRWRSPSHPDAQQYLKRPDWHRPPRFHMHFMTNGSLWCGDCIEPVWRQWTIVGLFFSNIIEAFHFRFQDSQPSHYWADFKEKALGFIQDASISIPFAKHLSTHTKLWHPI